MSGSSHHVHTGVALVLPRVSAAAAAANNGTSTATNGGQQAAEQEQPFFCRTFSETTNVIFDELSTDLIDAYIKTGVCVL